MVNCTPSLLSHFSHQIGPKLPELALSFPHPVCPSWCMLLALYKNISMLLVPTENIQIPSVNYSILICVSLTGCPLSIKGLFFSFAATLRVYDLPTDHVCMPHSIYHSSQSKNVMKNQINKLKNLFSNFINFIT